MAHTEAALDVGEELPRSVRGATVFRRLFVPALLALSVASLCWREAIEGFLRATSVRMDAMTFVLLLSLLCVWIAEQIYPARPGWNYRLLSNGAEGWNSLGRDLFYLFVVTQLTALLIRGTSSQVTPAMKGLGFGYGVTQSIWPSQAPFPVRVILVFLSVELSSYWLHRASHRVPFLWRFHSTHHVVTELTGFKSLRVHPLDNAFAFVARNVPLMLLGVGVDEVMAVACLCGTLGILSHANIDVFEGRLGWVVNFPSYHAVHHSSDVAESSTNFGCHTVLWDRLFGTFRSSVPHPIVPGLLPVVPRSVWRELVRPLYRSVP